MKTAKISMIFCLVAVFSLSASDGPCKVHEMDWKEWFSKSWQKKQNEEKVLKDVAQQVTKSTPWVRRSFPSSPTFLFFTPDQFSRAASANTSALQHDEK